LRYRIHEPKGLFGQPCANTGQQAFLEFYQGRFNAVVPVACKIGQQSIQHRCLEGGVRGQHIGHSGW